MAAPKMFEFYKILCDDLQMLAYLRRNNLLKGEMNCSRCGHQMCIGTKKSKADGQEWMCKSCLSTASLRKDSIFEVYHKYKYTHTLKMAFKS